MSEPAWDDRSYHFGLSERELAANPVANWRFDDTDPAGRPQSWEVENGDYVRIVGDTFEGERAIGLRCDAQSRGRISQLIDVSELGGQKLFIRYRAKVEGSVVPHFVVELADGSTVEVPAAGGTEGTAVLAELHKHGWYPYDGLYGWLFWNDHLPVLYRDGWQTLGGIFTVPSGARTVRVTFEPRPARYNALERRKALVASGEVVIDSVQVGPTKRQLLADAIANAAGQWEGATYGADEFFYLSYVYNQSMIAKARLDMRLWEVLRAVHYAEQRGVPSAAIMAQLKQTQRKLDESYVQLAGLRRFYEARCSSYAAQLDFSELQREYPVGHAGPVGTTPAARTDYYLSLHIEKLIRDGFAPSSQLASALQSNLTAIGQDLDQTASRLREAVGERPEGKVSFPDRDLAYGEISLSKTAGKSPFFFATGNTGFPYRVYRDLGVDVISINYYSSELIDEEGRIAAHPSIARMLREQGQKQYHAMFFPAHYHFAVPNSFIAKHQDEVAAMLRIDKNGNSPVRLRDRKFGRHSRTKFEYDPSYTYYLPISIMHPEGRALLGRRLRGIADHVARADTRDTLIRLELGAENVNLLAPAHDEWTKKAFREYVAGKFGTVVEANRLLQTSFTSLDDIRYWDKAGHTDREKVKVERLKTEFMAIHSAQFYEEAIAQLSAFAPDLPVSNREDCLWFRDYSYLYAQKTTDLIDYHALYDRAYGYYLGRCVGKDHVTGEDLITGQSGLKTRDTIEQAFSKLLVVGWRQASWGTKSICIWNLYRDPYFIGAASEESLFSLINENWAALPQLKRTLRRFQDLLNGRIATPRTVIFQCEAQRHVSWYLPSVYSTVSYLKARNIDYGYSFEGALKDGRDQLSNYRLIFMPPSLFVREQLQRQFLNWLEEGGTLVTFGPFGLYDEYANDSQTLMDAVFGKARYHLIGDYENLRNYDGVYLALFEKGAREFPVGEVRPLPQGDERVYEKVFNDPRMIRGFRLDTAKRKLWGEKICTAEYGKGRVVLIPREYLPTEYASVLAEAAQINVEDVSAAWANEDGFEMMTRFHHNEEADPSPYVFIQNKDEWQGLRETVVSVRGAYRQAHDVGIDGGFPVTVRNQGNVTSFSVRLSPGEIAVIKLTK